MKHKILSFLFLTLLYINISTAAAAGLLNQENTVESEISRQQMEAQISFFDDALNEFGAATPDQAVALWAKGDETRNGVYKYSVSCDQLKQWLVNRWGKPKKSFWIIGGSSPWLTGYQIMNKKTLSPQKLQYTVKYSRATSAGPEKPSIEQLTVVKFKDKWCISGVKLISGYQYY